MPAGAPVADVLRVGRIDFNEAAALLVRYGLTLLHIAPGEVIPGSYWGDVEAGIIGTSVYVRDDTPVHSLFHEACHLIVLQPEQRAQVHTDATDSIDEENAVCLLQILLGEMLTGVDRFRLLGDMDRWGYTFRLGSARAYFEQDADDAWLWLQTRGFVDDARRLILP